MLKVTFFSLQYMGSFPVAIPDIASRAEYVRSQLETLRVSTLSDKNFLKVFCDSFREINLDVYIYVRTFREWNSWELLLLFCFKNEI